MKNLLNKLKFLVWFLLLISILGLGWGFYYLYRKVDKISDSIETSHYQEDKAGWEGNKGTDDSLTLSSDCSNTCQDKIAKAVSAAIATISGSVTKEAVEKTSVVSQPSGGVYYVSLGTMTTTTSTDWVEVKDSAVYINLESDYGEGATVSWQASLKVAHGNGKAFARLYDDTNKIAVDFSEISTLNNPDFMQVSTGNLPFWRGRNLYKVQIKSLNSFEITYSGGKLRIAQ